jgi:riboflavin biosynthesis pyrimidine reductase
MALIATLVVGRNGATSKSGNSTGLSTPADRARFLTLHRSAAAIITGSKSAQSEDYARTTVPIFVYTRKSAQLQFSHPTMQQIIVDRDLPEITRRIEGRINGQVVIEAGADLLISMVTHGLVDELYLSIVPIDGDGNFIEVEKLLNRFEIESEENIDGTQLLQCRYKGNSSDS